jgi:1-acyl-sn-glycerol-3-phosphate acyltransferase
MRTLHGVGIGEVTAGPLFADDGPRGARVVRRTRGIVLEVVAFVLVTALYPLLLLGTLAVDTALWLRSRKPYVSSRLLAFAWWFLFAELRGLIVLAWLAVFTRAGSVRRRRAIYALRIHWARSHLAGIRVLFGLTFEIEGLELAGPGPEVILIRHASIIDNTLPDAVIGRHHGIGLRFVLKRELESIPVIDIGGHWSTTYFVRRASVDAAAEIANLRRLAQDIGSGEGILIYPEGTRHTPAKLARAQEVIAEQSPAVAPLANRLNNVLPPRLGGTLALLDEAQGADVVVFGHVGLDGFEYISDVWKGRLVNGRVAIKFWRYPAADVPTDPDERVEWLYEVWQRLDDWVGVQRNGLTVCCDERTVTPSRT